MSLKDNWLNFGLSYLFIAELGCKGMQKADLGFKISDLYISTIYNIKHGIEVLLKSMIVILENKELVKKDEIHNQKELLSRLFHIINLPDIKKIITEIIDNKEKADDFVFLSEKIETIEEQLKLMENLIFKYQHLKFLKDKIGQEFIIEDTDNTTFKYPQNSLKIKLDYEKIIDKITNDDILIIEIDINRLINIFISLFLIFSKYIDGKK